MALKLNIQKFSCYSNDKATASTSSTVSLLTDKTTAELYLKAKGSDTVIHLYVLSLVNLSFQKKMYQPTEVVAEILFTPKEENDDWFPIAKDDIMTMFENKQVSLYDMAGVTTTGGVDTVPDANYVGEDFYIHQVTPCYHSKSLCVKLIICSLDKQLTIENNSRTFVAKKLGEEILTTELSKQKKPFDNSCTIGCETANMYRSLQKYPPASNDPSPRLLTQNPSPKATRPDNKNTCAGCLNPPPHRSFPRQRQKNQMILSCRPAACQSRRLV